MSSQVTIKGRIVKDPELRFTNSGTPVASFTVVTARRVKNAQDQWEDADVSYWDCTAFKEFAENIVESCEKGTSVVVTGAMRQEKWQTKDGEARTSWKILVDDMGVSCKFKKVAVFEGQKVSAGSSFTDEPPF